MSTSVPWWAWRKVLLPTVFPKWTTIVSEILFFSSLKLCLYLKVTKYPLWGICVHIQQNSNFGRIKWLNILFSSLIGKKKVCVYNALIILVNLMYVGRRQYQQNDINETWRWPSSSIRSDENFVFLWISAHFSFLLSWVWEKWMWNRISNNKRIYRKTRMKYTMKCTSFRKKFKN